MASREKCYEKVWTGFWTGKNINKIIFLFWRYFIFLNEKFVNGKMRLIFLKQKYKINLCLE